VRLCAAIDLNTSRVDGRIGMHKDPIVAEVRATRDRQAEKFRYDVRAILEDARKRQYKSGFRIVSHPPKRVTVPE
jgi:hypothetical protein